MIMLYFIKNIKSKSYLDLLNLIYDLKVAQKNNGDLKKIK